MTVAVLLGFAFVISASATIRADDPESWSADASHTEINFSVTHVFAAVTGSFGDYEVQLDYDTQHPEASSLEARIEVASINTGNQEGDYHLGTADGFEDDTHPYITFTSASVQQVDENPLIVSGPLIIKGISHQVELPVTILGTQTIPQPVQQLVGGAKETAHFRHHECRSRLILT